MLFALCILAVKSDVWLEIDPHSGKKLNTISSNGVVSSCPAADTYLGSVFIGRTGMKLRQCYIYIHKYKNHFMK